MIRRCPRLDLRVQSPPVTTSRLRFFAELIHFNSNFFSFANVPTPPSVCVLAFSQSFFKGLATQLATPLNPSDDAKLDHSSGTPDSMAIYPKPGQTLLYTTYDR